MKAGDAWQRRDAYDREFAGRKENGLYMNRTHLQVFTNPCAQRNSYDGIDACSFCFLDAGNCWQQDLNLRRYSRQRIRPFQFTSFRDLHSGIKCRQHLGSRAVKRSPLLPEPRPLSRLFRWPISPGGGSQTARAARAAAAACRCRVLAAAAFPNRCWRCSQRVDRTTNLVTVPPVITST